MKYNEIDLNEKLFGDDFIVYDWKEDTDKIIIYVKATSHDDVCPVCGAPTYTLHNTYHRLTLFEAKKLVWMSLPISTTVRILNVIGRSLCRISHS